jgi:hypothetical protein
LATYVTVDKLVQRLTRLSGQVPGTSVQVYSTDIFVDLINSAVRLVARRYWWPHLMDTITTATDGSTGVLTADLSKIKDFTDIQAVFAGNNCRPLPVISGLNNPVQYSGSSAVGFKPIRYGDAQYGNKLIRIVPAAAVETVVVSARYMPDELTLTSMLPLDQDMILYAVLWAYFEDEGDNPQQAMKYYNLYENRYNDEIAAFAAHGIPVGSANPSGSNDWQYAT